MTYSSSPNDNKYRLAYKDPGLKHREITIGGFKRGQGFKKNTITKFLPKKCIIS